MNLLSAFVFSLVSVVGYSLISIYIGQVTKKYGAFWVSFWIQVLGLLVTLAFIPFFGFSLPINKYFISLIIYSFGITIAFILYAKNLSVGPPSVVQAILRVSNIITFILAIVFFKESLSLYKILGSLVMICGVIMVSLDISSIIKKKVKFSTKALPLTVFSGNNKWSQFFHFRNRYQILRQFFR